LGIAYSGSQVIISYPADFLCLLRTDAMRVE
jgi:hypothetical protein